MCAKKLEGAGCSNATAEMRDGNNDAECRRQRGVRWAMFQSPQTMDGVGQGLGPVGALSIVIGDGSCASTDAAMSQLGQRKEEPAPGHGEGPRNQAQSRNLGRCESRIRGV